MIAKLNPKELEEALAGFTGSEQCYRLMRGAKFCVTEGVKFLMNEAECHWLVVLYWSHIIKVNHEETYFTVLNMAVKDGKGDVVIDDGDDNVLSRQYIPSTDFPLVGIKLYASWSGTDWICMLPSEY